MKKYKYNIDLTTNQIQLQHMMKRDDETFKEYAQRWREIASQIEPPFFEKEMATIFVDTLKYPFMKKILEPLH